MSFQLIIIKSAPYAGRQSHEILEAVMSLALFDIEHRIVFFEQGLGWLLPNQQPVGQKSLEKQLAALPMYGSESLHYCQEHAESVLNDLAINDQVSPITSAALAQWIQDAAHVEVF
ncbi:DsrE family protein [Reinekea blandensis]|uniref:Uncharacterized protein n=1 Tax=Reinekea blandensis MED297 TaxID=314283 RepID=A4BDR3_9GAMM|nr:DsrE family protein [Reinekea blandensis]EAR09672.1 hypothetical protein MED297_15974 [Reinekea blandensis MED297]